MPATRNIAVTTGLILSQAAAAQCLDWASGFGLPGLGFNEYVAVVRTFDLGQGPQLFAGGKFYEAAGSPAVGIARWTGSGWTSMGAGLGNLTSGYGGVYILGVYDDGSGPALYGGGGFSLAGGSVANYLARWNGAAWSALPQQPNDTVYALCPYDGKLFVGGQLTAIDGQPTQRIAAWNGSSWQLFRGGPSPRSGHSLVYDAARQNTVMFGGTTNGSPSGSTAQTWTWDGAQWTQAATSGPPASSWSASVYDSTRQRVLLTAGNSGAAIWSWQGTAWTQVEPHPPTMQDRHSYTMVYDDARDRVVLFGGQASCCTQVQFGDTWEYDGKNWAQVATSGPPPRARHAMAYDQARQRVVLHGGANYSLGELGDTWEWDGETWAQNPAPGPGTRYAHSMTYDSVGARVLLFGGIQGTGSLPDMWQCAGGTWSLVHPPNPAWPPRGGPIVFDAARAEVIQQSSLGTTWVYAAGAWDALNLGAFDQTVRALAEFDAGSGPMLYAGGEFGNVGGLPCRGLARLEGDSWRTLPVTSLSGNIVNVRALLPASGPGGPRLYVGGIFEWLNGATVNSVAAWNGSSWSQFGQGLGDVSDLAIYDDGTGAALYAAGGFWLAPGGAGLPPSGFVAKWTGSDWVMAGSGVQAVLSNDRANSLAVLPVPGGARLWVGGQFSKAGHQPSKNIARWGEPCGAPAIVQHPQSQTAVFNQTVILSVQATGTAPLTYQWRLNEVPLANASPYSGVDTATLQIGAWSLNHAGDYDVVVTNTFGQAVSNPATLTIPNVGPGGAVAVTPILLAPQAVPGMPGHTFTDFSSPVQSSTGEAVLRGYIAGPNNGEALLLWQDDTLSILHKQWDQAPNTTPGVTFTNFDAWLAAANGQAAFSANLQGPGVTASNNSGLWHRDETGTVRIIREGLEAPGTGGNQFASIGLGRTNGAGQVVYSGCLNGAGTPPLFGCGRWLWSRSTGSVLAALAGDAAPGTTSTFTSVTGARINEPGLIALHATWDTGSKSGIWTGSPGVWSPVIKTGDAALGPVPTGSTIGAVVENTLLLNNAGGIATAAHVRDAGGAFLGTAVYAFGSKTLAPIAVPGQPAPGAPAGMYMTNAAPYAFNDTGRCVFVSSITGKCGKPVCPSAAIWVGDGTSTALVLINRSDPPPTAPSGFIYGTVDAAQIAINSLNQVVIQIPLEYGQNWSAVYGWTPAAGLFPIAVPGAQLEITTDQYKTVGNAYLATVNGASTGTTSTSLNDGGVVIFQVGFTDGTRGIFSGHFAEFAGSYFNCPTVIAAPAPIAAYGGTSASFSVGAVGAAGPLSYQWRRNGVPLVNAGPVSGATTDRLTIDPVSTALAGAFDVVISNPCGATTSPAAMLTVLCYPDCNEDGALTVADFGCFQNKFVIGDPYADCTGDGVQSVADFGCFQTRFVIGCP